MALLPENSEFSGEKKENIKNICRLLIFIDFYENPVLRKRIEKNCERELVMKKQHNPRVNFNSEGLRAESIFALRWTLEAKDIEEGEFLSNLFDEAVMKLHRNAGEAMLSTLKRTYFEKQQELDCD